MATSTDLPIELWCKGCNTPKHNKEFYPNHNKYHMFERMNYCKECCKTISQDIMSNAYTYEIGMRYVCVFFDMPFLMEAMTLVKDKENTRKTDKNWNYVNEYGLALKTLEVPFDKWNNLSGNSFIGFDMLRPTTNVKEDDAEMLMGLEKDWGVQESLNDYLFLEEKFAEYSKGEELTPSMTTTMRYLCLAELEVSKLKASKQPSKEAEKRVMDYYKTLKLDNFTLSESKSTGEKILEKWTAIEENTRPLEVFDKLFADDMCHIRDDYDHIMRATKNLVSGSRDYPDFGVE